MIKIIEWPISQLINGHLQLVPIFWAISHFYWAKTFTVSKCCLFKNGHIYQPLGSILQFSSKFYPNLYYVLKFEKLWLLNIWQFLVHIPYSNRICPTAVAGEADSVSSVSASACHIGGPNSVNPGQILLVYGTHFFSVYIKLFSLK